MDTPVSAPVVGLRSVHYAAFASEETACFEAVVTVDGKPFCLVRNEGHGGADHFEPFRKGQTYPELAAAILALAKRINPQTVEQWSDVPKVEDFGEEAFAKVYEGEWWTRGVHTADSILSGIVGHLLDVHLQTKKLARDLKTKLLVQTRAGKVWTYKLRKPIDLDAAIRQVTAKQESDGDPVVAVLNRLPLGEAVEIVLKAA